MFIGFLSNDMTYSCAIFEDLDGDLTDTTATERIRMNGGQGLTRLGIEDSSPHNSQKTNIINNAPSPSLPEEDVLYAAQMRKLHHIIAKARIEPGQRVLEIGSGWGSLSILIAQTVPDTEIDTLTLSIQQKQLAEERIHAAGLDGRVRVHLMDYRDMPPEWEGAFDRLVSVEMIEAVGKEFLETYWRTVDWALDRKRGVGVVQVITIPEARKYSIGEENKKRYLDSLVLFTGFEKYMQEIDFIRKWVCLVYYSH
jgi:cyclopropane-fatty-acyl-phospholipid synthase